MNITEKEHNKSDKNLIEIRFKDVPENEKINELKLLYIKELRKIIQFAKENGIWTEKIKKIIVTNDYIEDVHKQAKIMNDNIKLSFGKEFISVSQIVSNKNEAYIFISIHILPDDRNFRDTILNQIINVYVRTIVPSSIKQIKNISQFSNLDDYINQAIGEWVEYTITNMILKDFSSNEIRVTNDNLFINFARRLRNYLFEYQSDYSSHDKRLKNLWNKTYVAFYELIRLSLENRIFEEKYELNFPYEKSIKNIIEEIYSLSKKVYNSKNHIKISNTKIKEGIIQLFSELDIHITERSDNTFHIKLNKNPKEYFKNEIIETEPRIVCFMDILGFKELIKEYEKNPRSTLLQEIKSAFDDAIKIIQSKPELFYEHYVKYLEYKTFSDNICISIPYFDNTHDFLLNLNIIVSYVVSLQYSLMLKGFFTRGGFSIGSYYSDNNIIFSNGLVKAYLLEKGIAEFPRIIIDNELINKINELDNNKFKAIGPNKLIIKDYNENYFINSLGLTHIFNAFQNKWENLEFHPLLNDFKDSIINIRESVNSKRELFDEKHNNNISIIEKKINENLEKYENNENIYKKYLWLKNYIDWVKGKNEVNNFFYFAFQ